MMCLLIVLCVVVLAILCGHGGLEAVAQRLSRRVDLGITGIAIGRNLIFTWLEAYRPAADVISQ